MCVSDAVNGISHFFGQNWRVVAEVQENLVRAAVTDGVADLLIREAKHSAHTLGDGGELGGLAHFFPSQLGLVAVDGATETVASVADTNRVDTGGADHFVQHLVRDGHVRQEAVGGAIPAGAIRPERAIQAEAVALSAFGQNLVRLLQDFAPLVVIEHHRTGFEDFVHEVLGQNAGARLTAHLFDRSFGATLHSGAYLAQTGSLGFLVGALHHRCFRVDADFHTLEDVFGLGDFERQTLDIEHGTGADQHVFQAGAGDAGRQNFVHPLTTFTVDVSVTGVRHIGGDDDIVVVFLGQIASNQALTSGAKLQVDNEVYFRLDFHVGSLLVNAGEIIAPVILIIALAPYQSQRLFTIQYQHRPCGAAWR